MGAKHIHCCLRTYIAMLRLTEPLLARRFSVGMKTLNTLYLESKVAKRIEDFPAKITREYAIPFAYSPAWYGNEPKPPTPVKPTDEQLRGFDAQSQCLLEESRDKIKAIADKEERRARRIQLRDKLVSIAEQHSFSSGAWVLTYPEKVKKSSKVDWSRIYQATEQGVLGHKSVQIETIRWRVDGPKLPHFRILVYTYNFRDRAHIWRVLAKLRKLDTAPGPKQTPPIFYKPEALQHLANLSLFRECQVPEHLYSSLEFPRHLPDFGRD